MYTELFYATLFAYFFLFYYPYILHHYLFRSLFLLASRVLCAQPAGPKIALRFLCLSIYTFVCASALIMCAIIMSHTLLPCDFTLVDFGNSFRWLLCVATMSSLAQSQWSNSSSETDPSSNTSIQSKTGQHNLHIEC